MNCSEAIGIIDRMIFEEVPADAGLLQHLNTCPECSRVYDDALQAREVLNMVRRSEPVLRDPGGLTADIMAVITKDPGKASAVPMFLVRLLSAASVALFLLFGYEQYSIVKKISELEKQCADIKADSRYSSLLQQASTMNISEAGISFSELERLLSTEKGRTPLSVLFMKKQSDQKNKK